MTRQMHEGVVADGSKITTRSSVSNVMRARYQHGDEWQNYITDKFEEMGIQPTFIKIKDSLGNRIADYQYANMWIEAKTYINNAEVAKIKTLYQELSKINYKMAIMCEWKPGYKKYHKEVSLLRNMGIYVFEGQSQCDSFIIDESIRLNVCKTILMAKPITIDIKQLVKNPDNREKNSKNIPVIKQSIVKHGFFTQLNVVPHEMKEIDGEMKMTYMLFEGHTRYYALMELYEKGYDIPPITCSLVDWITSKDINKLHDLLIRTNTTYSGWKLRNYITSNKSNLEKLNDYSGAYSYGMILKSMNQAKKQKWGETTPIYLFAHKDSLDFNDMKTVKEKLYRITESEYNEQIHPLLDLMSSLTSKNKFGEHRTFSGTIIRDILVYIRVKYNTDGSFKKDFKRFLKFVDFKLKNDYDSDFERPEADGSIFPKTQESGKIYWSKVLNEYIGLQERGIIERMDSDSSKMNIMNFV